MCRTRVLSVPSVLSVLSVLSASEYCACFACLLRSGVCVSLIGSQVGYGVEDAYHADNEFARLSDFEKGFTILCKVISSLAK